MAAVASVICAPLANLPILVFSEAAISFVLLFLRPIYRFSSPLIGFCIIIGMLIEVAHGPSEQYVSLGGRGAANTGAIEC
jgi:hypothetical protein